MSDFKVRVLDFLSIYVKQKSLKHEPTKQVTLIRGLLKALSTAHVDKNTILFERVKTILAQLARQNQ